jgi:hypothetical protein
MLNFDLFVGLTEKYHIYTRSTMLTLKMEGNLFMRRILFKVKTIMDVMNKCKEK